MTEPRIVSPEEAQGWADVDAHPPTFWPNRLAHTVATEPDRTRSAVVTALRDEADMLDRRGWTAAGDYLRDHADAIENGADW